MGAGPGPLHAWHLEPCTLRSFNFSQEPSPSPVYTALANQGHSCLGSLGTVQTRVDGRKKTGGPRTPPCSNSWFTGSEIATEGQATQDPSITSQASREERRLPGKVQGAPLPPPAALPSQPVTVLHISGLSPLSSPRATVLSPGHTLLPLGERSNANWPTYFRLVPATNLSPLQPKRGFFQRQSFH